jgi:hypothetical protein
MLPKGPALAEYIVLVYDSFVRHHYGEGHSCYPDRDEVGDSLGALKKAFLLLFLRSLFMRSKKIRFEENCRSYEGDFFQFDMLVTADLDNSSKNLSSANPRIAPCLGLLEFVAVRGSSD